MDRANPRTLTPRSHINARARDAKSSEFSGMPHTLSDGPLLPLPTPGRQRATSSRLPVRAARLGGMSPRNERSDPGEHFDDPDRPGWCGKCRAAYPCPGTAADPPREPKQWPPPHGHTFQGGAARERDERTAREVERLRRDHRGWSIWFSPQLGFRYYAATPNWRRAPADKLTADTPEELEQAIDEFERGL